ncbi:MAG TPA: hypothetical protein DCQ94_02870, partial [Nitrospira sp.]|nr:hypothetical protein [Nitrospira sp.]
MSTEQIPSRPLPVTMVCGCAGAGKSRVIREWVAECGGERWALLLHDRSEHEWAAVDGTGHAMNIYSLGE